MFKDHFSGHAAQYSAARPHYPQALFKALATLVSHHHAVWDCATGSGQAAVELADYFDHVIATDASEKQISNALAHERVAYRVAPAENSGLDDQSVNMVTVAQALHWFDFDAFYSEVRRVLMPGGVLATWGYGTLHTDNSLLNKLIYTLYEGPLAKYWPKERRYIDEGYQTIPFPFKEIDMPVLAIEPPWNVGQLIAYLNTWSGVHRFIEAEGYNPISTDIVEALAKNNTHWQEESVAVSMPILFRVGRL